MNRDGPTELPHAPPIVFVRTLGIAAGDAMRLLELAKRLDMPVRWRLAPSGVAADVYIAHRCSVIQAQNSSPSAEQNGAAGQVKLDIYGRYLAKPVCVLGSSVAASALQGHELAPLSFPDALSELKTQLDRVLPDLFNIRMLFCVGAMAWQQRSRWFTSSLHVIESGRLIAVVDPKHWMLFLLEGCTLGQISRAQMLARPREGDFQAKGFTALKLEAAFWEYAKRCSEELLVEMLPASYHKEPFTHRRPPHLSNHALGGHCVAILQSLDLGSRTFDDLHSTLRIPPISLLRALTCLLVVRAIQPQSSIGHDGLRFWQRWWDKLLGSSAPHLPWDKSSRL